MMKVNYKLGLGAVNSATLAAGVDKFPAIEIHKAEGGGVELWATDAYRLHLVTIPAEGVEFHDDDALPIRVNAKELLKAFKASKGAESVEILPYSGGFTFSSCGIKPGDTGISLTIAEYVGHYEIPNPYKLFRGEFKAPEATAFSVIFNADYVEGVTKAASAISNPKGVSQVFFDGSENGVVNRATRWRATNPDTGVSLTAYLMPIKGPK